MLGGKIMNKSYLFNDTVKVVEYAKWNSDGNKTISEKNACLIAIVQKALKLSIGGNIVVSRNVNNKTFVYKSTTGVNNSYEKTSSLLSENSLVNLLTICNIFLTDRYYYCYYNKDNALTIKCFNKDNTPSQLLIADKDYELTSEKKAYNQLEEKEISISSTTIKGKRQLNEKDIKNFEKILKDVDLFNSLKPLAIKVEKEEKLA